MAEFAMVEELASLVKDNLHCKQLIMTIECKLISFLEDDSSWSRVLELEPMNPYDRLLVHRLVDIFGFSHHSVGEGESRHLILQRCPETSLPSILVSDLLWRLDEPATLNFDILRREEGNSDDYVPSETRHAFANEPSVEEREKAYLAARERIFSSGNRTSNQRPQNNPAVARRMITRALGKTDRPLNQDQKLRNDKKREEDQNHGSESSSSKVILQRDVKTTPDVRSSAEGQNRNQNNGFESPSSSKVILQRDVKTTPDASSSAKGQNGNRVLDEKALRKEREVAAKRLFANALGVQFRGATKQKQPTSELGS